MRESFRSIADRLKFASARYSVTEYSGAPAATIDSSIGWEFYPTADYSRPIGWYRDAVPITAEQAWEDLTGPITVTVRTGINIILVDCTITILCSYDPIGDGRCDGRSVELKLEYTNASDNTPVVCGLTEIGEHRQQSGNPPYLVSGFGPYVSLHGGTISYVTKLSEPWSSTIRIYGRGGAESAALASWRAKVVTL